MTATKPQRQAAKPVLLFDGECGLCNRLVRVLLRLDRDGRLKFAPLQGRSAQAFLRAHGLSTADFDTLIFVPDWERSAEPAYLSRTDGVIAALRATQSRLACALAATLGVLPTRWRDAGYRVIARWRYRLFGPWRPRLLGRAEWKARFLDGVE